MRIALLDVSVLFALIYERHPRHSDVHAWFAQSGAAGWATCSQTQMSVMRLLGSSFAEDLNLTMAAAASLVRKLCEHRSHQYWPQDIVPSGNEAFHWPLARGRNQLADLYLLALAVRQGGGAGYAGSENCTPCGERGRGGTFGGVVGGLTDSPPEHATAQ